MDNPQHGIDIDLQLDPRDAARAVDVMHRAFAEYAAKGQPSGAMTETAQTMAEEMQAGERIALVRSGGVPVAVAKHHPNADGRLYFGRLGVVPEARGEGIAGALVRRLRHAARDEGLQGLACTVRADELGNIALYERLGMIVVSRGERISRTGVLLQVVDMEDPAP